MFMHHTRPRTCASNKINPVKFCDRLQSYCYGDKPRILFEACVIQISVRGPIILIKDF